MRRGGRATSLRRVGLSESGTTFLVLVVVAVAHHRLGPSSSATTSTTCRALPSSAVHQHLSGFERGLVVGDPLIKPDEHLARFPSDDGGFVVGPGEAADGVHVIEERQGHKFGLRTEGPPQQPRSPKSRNLPQGSHDLGAIVLLVAVCMVRTRPASPHPCDHNVSSSAQTKHHHAIQAANKVLEVEAAGDSAAKLQPVLLELPHLLALSVAWPGGLPCPWNRGTIEHRGMPSGLGSGAGLVGSACGWGSGMSAPSGQIPPLWAWWETEAPTATRPARRWGAAPGPGPQPCGRAGSVDRLRALLLNELDEAGRVTWSGSARQLAHRPEAWLGSFGPGSTQNSLPSGSCMTVMSS
jgi:hypothetical protein